MKIILIGFMCSGKTTIAPLLAKKLSLKVVETDDLVRQLSGKTIEEIFKEYGEMGYREFEIAVAKSLQHEDNAVISTGGGMGMNKIILDYMKENATTVFLETTFDTIVKRLDPKMPRPLFQNTTQAKHLYDFRQP